MRERLHMSNAARLVTAEELEKFPSDDNRYELVRGQVVRMSPVGYQHSRIVTRLISRLDAHVQRRSEPGDVLTELGFKLRSSPDTVRAPDVAFVRRERVPSPRHSGFLEGPPDLAIEVLSPDDRPHAMTEKVAEYLSCGVPLVVVIDPEEQTAAVFRPGGAPVTLGSDDVLDLDDVVPGFACGIAELFT